ncbi:myo-inositol 2-dehydrogenase, partial [Mesorhizobium sp. M0571]
LIGENGAVATNNVAYTRTESALTQSTNYDADWRTRYYDAYRRQNRDFLRFVMTGEFPATASDCWDGYCAAVVAEAGVVALKEARRTPVQMIAKPEFYA